MALEMEIGRQLVNIDFGLPNTTVACMILNIVCEVKSGAQLVERMRELKERVPALDHYFVYGYGGAHMWVKQRECQKENVNWLTVYF